jgi:exodeoxyribonuclease VII small subunit
MAKKKAKDSEVESTEEITFEQALEELEQIVGRLEGGKLALADSLSAYELGVKRLGSCYRMLTSAERRIELVQSVSAGGEASTRAFDDADAEDLAEKSASRSRRRTARVEDDGGLF